MGAHEGRPYVLAGGWLMARFTAERTETAEFSGFFLGAHKGRPYLAVSAMSGVNGVEVGQLLKGRSEIGRSVWFLAISSTSQSAENFKARGQWP